VRLQRSAVEGAGARRDCRLGRRVRGYRSRVGWLGCDVAAISFPKLNSSKQFTETEWKDEIVSAV
jgi:hypothetical protein